MALVYDSDRSRPAPWREAAELWRYRDLLLLLVARNVKTRYKRSFLGVLWTMLNPLLTMLVLTLVFSSLFQGTLRHYPVYLLSGLLPWNFVAQTTTAAMHDTVWSGGLIRRVYLPRASFAVAAVGTGLVNLCLALLPMGVIALATGLPVTLAWAFLPIAALLASAFALGLGLFLSGLAVFFADVVDMYQIVLMAWMYLTPVMYPPDILPPGVAWVLRLNPMAYLLELFRAPIYSGRWPEWTTVATATLVALATLALGWWSFSRKGNELAYRL